ncbi:hypothetical protein B0T25DRAFT_30183 [Lasiosphaeria hispida]|uniref:Uncharacterized protein n=1 Tax=Lasiosphaeria hispida TaxID=260671 RepID=A0AAJ0HUE6_9PEZI|nr:hypothetical protein B0T25DRAFT_30183 [Lasiosphaeria hispida]
MSWFVVAHSAHARKSPSCCGNNITLWSKSPASTRGILPAKLRVGIPRPDRSLMGVSRRPFWDYLIYPRLLLLPRSLRFGPSAYGIEISILKALSFLEGWWYTSYSSMRSRGQPQRGCICLRYGRLSKNRGRMSLVRQAGPLQSDTASSRMPRASRRPGPLRVVYVPERLAREREPRCHAGNARYSWQDSEALMLPGARRCTPAG